MMSVDIDREKHHINRVRVEALGDFLTAQTYRPEIVEAINKVTSLQHTPLQALCSSPIRQGPTPVFSTEGRPCLKSKHANDLIVSDPESSDFVDEVFAKEHEKQKVKFGDVVLTRKGVGTIGRASIFYGKEPLNTDDLLFKISLTLADNAFVTSFLRTYWGERILEKGVYGSTGQISLSSAYVRGVPIYTPFERAQKYIGDKVRQAERLRCSAKEQKAEVNIYIDTLGLPYNRQPEMINKVGARDLSDRLDPRPYRTHCLELVEAIKKVNNSFLSDCVAMHSGCPVSSSDFTEDYSVPLVRIRNIGFDEFLELDIGVSNDVYQSNLNCGAKAGCIVLGMDGDFRAQFFLEEELPMLINQRVAIFNHKDIRPELLTHWLNRPEGQIQLYQWAVKTTVDHTSLSDLRKVHIPRFDHDKEEEMADMLKFARFARYYSRKLTMSAILITEALIEGKLTERQLIDAEKTLEFGDNDLDRGILSRLTTKGLDGDSEPLFADLDQLYDLLAQSQQTDE